MNYAETIHPLIVESDQLIKEIIFGLAPLYKDEFPHGQDVTVPLFTVLHSTTESVLILLLNGAIYESDVLLRTIMEGTIKYCYLMCGSADIRALRYREYKDELTEIDKLLDHRKALEAIEILREFSNNSLKPFEISILNDETVAELEAKYPNKKRSELKQKWSYSHLLRELAKDNKEYEGQLATLSSYSLMSHFCHFDWTGVSSRNEQIMSAAKGDEALDIGHALRILSNALSCYLFRVAEYMRGNSYSTPELMKITMDMYGFVERIDKHQNELVEQEMG